MTTRTAKAEICETGFFPVPWNGAHFFAIYRGADGDFTLYEDENDGYNYEKGVFATIQFHRDDAKQTLGIGERKGEFPGIPAERTFQAVFVRENHRTSIMPENKPDKAVHYSGKQITVTP